ncbi:Nn.00g045270.m01.CDS01 [Neocucurbitaria sp. VM-36]
MASNHVPSDQAPMPGQNIYADPSYQNLFSSVDRYGTPSWDAQLNQHSGLAPSPSTQTWHHGSFTQQPFSAISQPYGNQSQGLRTASPYQYGQFGQQGSVNNYGQASNVDPALGLDPNAIRQQQQSPYQMPMRNVTPQGQSGTVTPQALQQNATSVQNVRPSASPFQIPKSTSEIFAQHRTISAPFVKPVRVPEYEIPKGRKSGGLYVLDQTALAKATNSTALNKFVTLGSEPFHLATNRTALPLYTPRLSLKDLKKAGADNKKLAKLSSSKSSLSKTLKSEKKATSNLGLKREISDSESYTESSDDDSGYTDDEEEEQSPLPASRPEEPHEAVRYDVIKATWYPRASPLSSEKIKNSMRDIWEVLNTIQKRWRTDSKAVSEAEDQKKTGELPVLKSRVASQRDLLQSALKAALELAHPDVLYHLGQIKPFLYLCYQFLANRFHSKDYDGPLSAVIFEILSRCGTLTSELLEETKVIKALVSMKKHANEKHKAFIQQVVDGAASNSKKAKAGSPSGAEPAETKGVKRPTADPGSRIAGEAPVTKRSKPAEALTTTAKKDTTKSTATTSASLLQKRPGERPATTPMPVKARVNQVSNKPSGIFASLNAASKKPATTATAPTSTKATALPKPAAVAAKDKKPVTATTSKPAFSFAQTMASLLKPKEQEAAPAKSEKQLPPETPEEKTKRLRKESRRHLRVTFRPDTSLVSIRYFDHAPEEDMGHEENLVRDAGDIGGEGRMFKQHKELDIDEDEDDAEAENRPWREPSLVDFSVIKPDERQRNYMPFGGGENQPSCPEKEANVRRENNTLMVFYSHPSDIPSTPREPQEESTSAVTVTNFGPPPDLCLQRCPQPSIPAAVPDLSNLENIFKQFATPASSQPQLVTQPAPVQSTYSHPQPPAPAPAIDLASILSALNGQNAPQPPAPAPMPVQAPVQQSMPAGLDFNAMMALIQAQAATGGALPPPPPGLPPGFPPFPFSFPSQPPQQQDAPAPAAAYQPQMHPQYDQQGNGGTKRQRDDGNNNAERGQGKRHKNRGERPHKVLACKFFQKGTCNKGDNCTYIHDMNM